MFQVHDTMITCFGTITSECLQIHFAFFLRTYIFYQISNKTLWSIWWNNNVHIFMVWRIEVNLSIGRALFNSRWCYAMPTEYHIKQSLKLHKFMLWFYVNFCGILMWPNGMCCRPQQVGLVLIMKMPAHKSTENVSMSLVLLISWVKLYCCTSLPSVGCNNVHLWNA